MKVYIKTYGCTLNQADSDIIRSVLQRDGAEIAEEESDADVMVVNTCTVKKATSQKILYKLNKLDKSGRKLVVTGCMAGANRDLIERYAPGASIITTPNIDRINEVALDAQDGWRNVVDSYKKTNRLSLLEPGDGVIAKIPVSDGCLSSCSFCETKFARGMLNSFPEETIIKAIETSVRMGAREVQLTSQDMGAYGADRNTNIARLMEQIKLIPGDFKVRVGMLNPDHLHKYFDAFADAIEDERFYKFVHIPVQSGSNSVISAMGRSCTIEQFEQHVADLRGRIPGVTIETDIIVGFPTERESDFEETVDFIRRAKPEVTNISRFAARPHTSASKVKQNSTETIKERSNTLSRVVRQVQHHINDRFIGKKFDVIITESNEKSFNGRNSSYRQVVVERNGTDMQIGSTYSLMIRSASANVLYA